MSGLKNLFKKIQAKNSSRQGWMSSVPSNSRSSRATKSIDDHLQRKADVQNRTLNLLLLGAGGSGKSTIMKQMDQMYNKDLNKNLTLPEYQQIILKKIHKNLMYDTIDLCKQYLILKSQMPDLRFENSELEDIVIRLASQYLLSSDYALTVSFATDIEKLWHSPVFRRVFDIRKKAHIMDNIPYFFDNIMKYASSNYQPTFEDYVRVRDRTNGIHSCTFRVQGLNTEWIFHAIDVGGQRAERRKWMKVFDNIDVVFYVMSLAAYDQVLYEDNNQRCWDETFSLFEQTINHKAFVSTDFIVFLNKCDIFADKIKKVSFMTYINGNQRSKNLAVAENRNNYRTRTTSSAMKHVRQSSNIVCSKRYSNGRFQKQKIPVHVSHESISINSMSGPNFANMSMDEKSDFSEVDGSSTSAVIKWTRNRFLDIFYASHGGKERYIEHQIANQRTISFHVTCATDKQQIQTVINIIKIQMLRRILNRNLIL